MYSGAWIKVEREFDSLKVTWSLVKESSRGIYAILLPGCSHLKIYK